MALIGLAIRVLIGGTVSCPPADNMLEILLNDRRILSVASRDLNR